MKVYTGIDIIETERIKKSLEDKNFITRVFTEKEITYCESRRNEARIQSYSARFAAKEAIYKAISEIFEPEIKIDWKQIEIIIDETKRPKVNLKFESEKVKNLSIDVSLSHIKEYAVASAVAVYEEKSE